MPSRANRHLSSHIADDTAYLQLEGLLIDIFAAVGQRDEWIQATAFAPWASRICITHSRHEGAAHPRLACQHPDRLAGLADDAHMRGFVLQICRRASVLCWLPLYMTDWNSALHATCRRLLVDFATSCSIAPKAAGSQSI